MTDRKILDLGNTPLSFETARNVLLDPDNAGKIFIDVPCINPSGGQAYIFQSPLALCKIHAKLDPYKFMYLGKGYNKEFAVMKRYYHLKHNRTDLNKQLYNFQRHIYCLAVGEWSSNSMNLYLVHYFGNDYLLQDAHYRKGVNSVAEHGVPPDVSYEETVIETQVSSISDIDHTDFTSSFPDIKAEPDEKNPSSQDFTPISESDELPLLSQDFRPNQDKIFPLSQDFRPMSEHDEIDSSSRNSISIAPLASSARKRKSITTSYRYRRETPPPEKRMNLQSEPVKAPSTELDNAGYMFAIHMAAQLQQMPKEIKARVKFQIATIFYEAEMKDLNCSTSD